MLPPRDLFAVLAIAFAIAAGLRWMRLRAPGDPALRAWAIISLIFGGVALWLSLA